MARAGAAAQVVPRRKASAPPRALVRLYEEAARQSRAVGAPVHVQFVVDPSGAATLLADAPPQRTSIVPPRETYPVENEGPPSPELQVALDAARARGQARVAEILAGPEMLSAEQFAGLIGTSRVTVNTRRQRHELLALDGTKRGYRFPAWQLDRNGKPFAALPALFDRLGGSAWAVYRFLVQSHPELDGRTGRAVLAAGGTAQAVAAAESVARDFQ